MSVPAVMADLKRAFPSREVTADVVALYERLLSDVDADDLRAAADDLMRTRDRFPTVHELREAVVERRLALPTEQEALAQVLARVRWGAIAVERDARGIETTGLPITVHPLAAEAVALVGGYHALRTTETPSILRAQFLRAYGDLRAARVSSTVRSTLQ